MGDTRLSVVIPTYYRGKGLDKTLEVLLVSDTSGIAPVEIVVVDDGSPLPVGPIVERLNTPNFSIRTIRQSNAGPASARNRGFFEAGGKIILFMDDDILASPNLLVAHYEAHKRLPGVVIHGPCLFAEDNGSAKLRQYLNAFSPRPAEKQEFVQVGMIASGHLSVEKSMFSDGLGVYRTDLQTPAAEEFELEKRLQDRGIPIFQATRIIAIHDQPVEIGAICVQQYKHAIGYAEVVIRCPETLTLPNVAAVLAQNGPLRWRDTFATKCKKMLKKCFAGEQLRGVLLRTMGPVAEFLPFRLGASVFHFLVGLFFFAGVRYGLARFSVPGTRDAQ